MLRGRESLVRLIGKRRRNLSLPPPPPPTATVPSPAASDAFPGKSSAAGCGSVDLDWVACPVCGKDVRGSDYMVNAHLDVCLARGKKRKLTQRTLLQFKFMPESKNETCSAGLVQLKSVRVQESHDKLQVSDTGGERQEFLAIANLEDDVDLFRVQEGRSFEAYISAENYAKADTFDFADAVHANGSGKVNTSCDTLEFPLCPLETFIVGRKFTDGVEVHQGEHIAIIREPGNPKDANAVKVISINKGEMLGYIPRELAKFISSLMSKYCLRFEGAITSLPKTPVDVIHIELKCQETSVINEMNSSDSREFEDLWRSVLEVVESAKIFPPTSTKYQQNFCFLINEVLKNHSHLFTKEERSFLGSFSSLSDDSQRLFIRLYSRKGPWFRIFNISYPEISNCQEAAEKLCESGYLRSFEPTREPYRNEIEEVLGVLTASELREMSNNVPLKLQKSIQCRKKKDYIEWMSVAYADGSCPSLMSSIYAKTKTCVKVSSAAEFLLWRVQRLFFLNGEQDLSSFLLVDLGLVKYPSYACKVSKPLFSSQDELIAYEKAIEVAQIIDESLDDNHMDMVIKCIETSACQISAFSGGNETSFLSCFSAPWVHSKVLTLGISFYERERRYTDAIRLLKQLLSRFYFDGRRGYWTLRMSIDLEHIGHLDESLTVAEEGVLDPWVRSGTKMAIQRRILRLGKPPRRWKIPSFAKSINRKIKEVQILGRPLNCDVGAKNRFYCVDGSQCGVEELALEYYSGEDGGGWKGVHTESEIWLTIFGLLMWDAIFADVPDVFQTKFQTAPLDLDTDYFYLARRNIIESQLERINHGLAEEILIISWESHNGSVCRGVNWDRHSLLDLRAAVSSISGTSLASLCRHLAQDYRHWSCGMPDLLLWRFLDCKQRAESKLVEVKGPNDRLSEQQRAWLLILMDCGFDVEVCKTEHKGRSSKSGRDYEISLKNKKISQSASLFLRGSQLLKAEFPDLLLAIYSKEKGRYFNPMIICHHLLESSGIMASLLKGNQLNLPDKLEY